MKKLLLIFLSLSLCLSAFACTGAGKDSSTASMESKAGESSETGVEDSNDISSTESVDNSLSTDTGANSSSDAESNALKDDDAVEHPDEDKIPSKTAKTYYEGEYTFDITNTKKQLGNITEWYSYTGENGEPSLLSYVSDAKVDGNARFLVGIFFTFKDPSNQNIDALNDLIKNAELLTDSPYIWYFDNGMQGSVLTIEEYRERTSLIVRNTDLSDYCGKELSSIPFFQMVGYFDAETLRAMSENGTINFYITWLPADDNAAIWLEALPECTDENCEIHK